MGFLNLLRKLANGFTLNEDSAPEPSGQILTFKNGILQKIVGDNDNWYDPDFIISDGVKYDMSDQNSIISMAIPTFAIVDPVAEYGATGMLDYVLRMKAGYCFERQEKEICSKLLWKSTELMLANKHCAWRQSDYERLITWHKQLGMDEEAEKARLYLNSKGFIILSVPDSKKRTSPQPKPQAKVSQPPKLSANEEKREIVKMTTDKHMQALTNFPFTWNRKIKKELSPGTHAFCYMDIAGENIKAVKAELEGLNALVKKDTARLGFPRSVYIPINDLIFSETEYQGYTKFICSPITITGLPAKYPLSIYLTTLMYDTKSSIPKQLKNTTHGEVFYGSDGCIAKADLYFWRNGAGYFLHYKKIDGALVLHKVG